MKFDQTYTVPKMIRDQAEKYGDIIAQYKRLKTGDFEPIKYRDLFQLGMDFAAALLMLGVQREEPIGLISDNRAEWLLADIGIISVMVTASGMRIKALWLPPCIS